MTFSRLDRVLEHLTLRSAEDNTIASLIEQFLCICSTRDTSQSRVFASSRLEFCPAQYREAERTVLYAHKCSDLSSFTSARQEVLVAIIFTTACNISLALLKGRSNWFLLTTQNDNSIILREDVTPGS